MTHSFICHPQKGPAIEALMAQGIFQLPFIEGAGIEALMCQGIFQQYDPFFVAETPVGHWDASKITGLNDNDAVTTWSDLIGGFDVTQSTTSKKPLYRTASFNGSHPCVSFDGTDDELVTAAGWSSSKSLTGNAVFTVFVVYQKNTVNKGHLYHWGNTGGLALHGFYDDNSVPQYGYDTNAYRVTARSNATPYVASYRKAAGNISTSSRSRRNGTDDDNGSGHSTNTPNIGNNTLRLGFWPSNYGHVDIAEFVVFNKALEPSKIDAIDLQLRAKWGI